MLLPCHACPTCPDPNAACPAYIQNGYTVSPDCAGTLGGTSCTLTPSCASGWSGVPKPTVYYMPCHSDTGVWDYSDVFSGCVTRKSTTLAKFISYVAGLDIDRSGMRIHGRCCPSFKDIQAWAKSRGFNGQGVYKIFWHMAYPMPYIAFATGNTGNDGTTIDPLS